MLPCSPLFLAVNDLKKQMKALEEQNDKLLRSSVEMEEQAKKIPALKQQLDKYKGACSCVAYRALSA